MAGQRRRWSMSADARSGVSILSSTLPAPGRSFGGRPVAHPEPRPLAYGAFWASLRLAGRAFDENALLQRYDSPSS